MLSYYVLPHLPDGYTAPDWLSIELGILGARLYFNFAEYAPLVKFLDIADSPNAENSALLGKQSAAPAGSLSTFLFDWLSIRRKGQDIVQTPMGYICQGRPLNERHPFFRTADANAVEVWGISGAKSTGEALEDEDSGTDHEYDRDGA